MNKLKPHKDIINKLPDILILGAGWVGQSVAKRFPGSTILDEHGLIEGTVHDHYDFAFICVPTPPNKDGSCDTSIVTKLIKKFKNMVDIFIVRSTVSMYSLSSYSRNTVFIPEYLGETIGHPVVTEKFVVIGGIPELTNKVAELFTLVSHSSLRIAQTNINTAILTKLMENAFYAMKVSFCNQMYDIAEKNDVYYFELRELWLLDERVSRDHTYVYPDNRGFGGKCLPKDLSNLIYGNNATLLKSMEQYNMELRNGTI